MSCLIHVVASSGLQNAKVVCLHGAMTGYTHGSLLGLLCLAPMAFFVSYPVYLSSPSSWNLQHNKRFSFTWPGVPLKDSGFVC